MITDKTSTKGRRRSEEKHRLIFIAAAELFSRRVFAGTSMDQIADVAGVSKQTVYSHFKSKQDLFIAAIQHKCTVNALGPAFFDRDVPIDHILHETAQYFTHLLINTEVVDVSRVCISEAEQHPEVARTFYESGPYKLTARLKSYLDKQVTTGKLYPKRLRFRCAECVNFCSPFF
ncbi:MAG: TetR/AcrR family transcriptional regulator [Exilibacterium sp.]